jgi:hypothetical protein
MRDVLLSGLAALVLLAGCATERALNVPSHYGQASPVPVGGIDSPSAACRHSLSACAALYGKEIASAGAVVKLVLDVTTRASIEQALTECADTARSEVLLRHQGDFEELSPTWDECNEPAKNAKRKGVTWAMHLGTEMHEEALECVGERLDKLRPGGFSLEQRYRYDRRTGRKKLVSPEEERLLEETGNGGELLGTLVPDVVIHMGDPLDVQAIYDFKFPCVNIDTVSDWNVYPRGHPYQYSGQGKMYHEALGVMPARVVPRLGIIR